METGVDLSPLLELLREVPGYLRLREGLGKGGEYQAVVADAAKALVLAALRRELAIPVVVVTARPDSARALYEGLAACCPPATPLHLFPEPDALPYERLSPDPSTVHDRLRALWALAMEQQSAPVVVCSAWAAASLTVALARFSQASLVLNQGARWELGRLMERLIAAGYEVEAAVEVPGTVSRRGGILDVFPPAAERPFRLEFLGNQIESIRLFDPATQRSLTEVAHAQLSPARELLLPGHNGPSLSLSSLNEEVRERYEQELALLAEGRWFPGQEFYAPLFHRSCLLDYLAPPGLLVWDEPGEARAALHEVEESCQRLREEKIDRGELPPQFPPPYLDWAELRGRGEKVGRRLGLERWGVGRGKLHLPFSSPPSFAGQWPLFLGELKRRLGQRQRVIIVSHQPRRLSELLWEGDVPAAPSTLETPPQPGVLKLIPGLLTQGWRLESPPLTLFTDAEIFGLVKEHRQLKKRPVRRSPFLADFKAGDFVVHIEHGIARFAGTTRMRRDGEEKDYLVLEYAEGDKLFVPTDQVERVSRYLGATARPPVVSRLGTEEWRRTKERVKRAAQDIARELLELYAARQVLPGFSFPPDSVWQEELEAAFPYVETPDQAQAVHQVKEDMQRPQPMDRLVCGDVGYGKTEVAIRAAFKAVQDGKQVAVLVPTTVLAQQHYNTFLQRLAPFPVKVEMLSRFRSAGEQQAILKGLGQGSIDICIGTHRLLQRDVAFKELGLVIVDEEQRFGVKHKERLKRMRQEVDVLTLSATPIPRTLYMSLAGVRDMSLMETPPEERQPVKTFVAEYQPELVREAVLRELERRGQVFYVHNRVHSIKEVAAKLSGLLPEASVTIAHGRMGEEELEQVMVEFTQGKWDVLVCTTIIESGLDMPNVNTLIVDDADRLGLTQLYQLRGRVGRGASRAYAYFLYRRGQSLTPQAQQRLKTIYEATELGAGFQIAMKDLEIRGAGNLLGAEQSGHIGAVGFDLYARLLAEAVAELKAGEVKPPTPPTPEPSLSLPLPAFLPETYIPDMESRLSLYHRLARVAASGEEEAIAGEMEDRFGPLPPEVSNLLYVVRVKALARQVGIEAVAAQGEQIVIRLTEGKRVDPSRLPATPAVRPGITQVRLDRQGGGEGWQHLLEQVLERMAG